MSKQAIISLLFFSGLTMLFQGCNGKSAPKNSTGEKNSTTQSEESNGSSHAQAEPVLQAAQSVCIYDGLAFWENPSTKKGYKYYNLNKGEIVTWTGKAEKEADDERQREFFQIILSDGSEGWALAAFVVPNAEPAAVVETASIYSKNSLISKTEKTYEPMDILAVVETQEDWIKVIGSYKDNPRWIRPGTLTKAEVDIAVANLATKALATKDPASQKEKLEDILAEEAFTDSIFMTNVQASLQEISASMAEENANPDSDIDSDSGPGEADKSASS